MVEPFEFISDCLVGLVLPSCLVCSALAPKNNRLCRLCHREFQIRTDEERLKPKQIPHPMLPSVNVRYLFDWVPNQDPALSKLLTGLKEGKSPATWKFLAKLFLKQHVGRLNVKEIALLPIPSRHRTRDHAFCWAEALAELIQVPVVQPLVRQTFHSQKRRSRALRKAIQFDLADRTAKVPRKLVIVDDIFTTGSTAQAAIRALQAGRGQFQPVEILEIWALAHRSRLAP